MLISRVTEVTDELLEAFQRLIPQLSDTNPPPTREELSALLKSDAVVLLIASQDNGSKPIVGALTLILFPVPTGLRAHIEDVIVDESARGQGVGRMLTDEALRLANKFGANGVMLTSNPCRVAANKLYQKMGFKRWETNLYFYEF